jgi:hypothetical protein
MSVITIPRILREKLGDDGAEALVEVLNKSENSKGLATTTDIARLEGEMIELKWKQKLYFLILLFVIIITNPKALDIIGKLLGLAK